MTRATLAATSATDRSPVSDFHLAIVGGCMSHQPGIPFNALYHRRLARVLWEETGIRMRPHVARGFGLDFGQRLLSLQERSEIDAVLLHLRVMVAKRARLVTRVRTADGSRRRLHPALFRRTHSGPAIDALRALEGAGVPDVAERETRAARHERRRGRIGGISMSELGLAAGALVGLDRWAVDDEMLRLAGFVEECERRGLPLFILGPTPLLNQPWAVRSIDRLNEAIGRYCAARGLPHALIASHQDVAGNAIVKADGLHLTTEGHQFVADRLVDAGFADWVVRLAASA